MPHGVNIAAPHKLCSLHTCAYVAQQFAAVGKNYCYFRSRNIPHPFRFSKHKEQSDGAEKDGVANRLRRELSENPSIDLSLLHGGVVECYCSAHGGVGI